MPRFVRCVAFVLVCLTVFAPIRPGVPLANAEPAPSSSPAAEMLRIRVLGDVDAPVTLAEYSSLTCPHCATFHRDTLPQLKAMYIDTGKVRMVYHDFPLDPLALAAAMITRCVPEDRYWPFLDRLFLEQATWAGSEKPAEALAALAAEAGLDANGFKACFANAPLMAGLRDNLQTSAETLDIRSTPTFFIDGEKVSGARPFADFQAVIERKLAEAAAAPAGTTDAAGDPGVATSAPVPSPVPAN